MSENCGLKFDLLYVHASQFFKFEIPPWAKEVIFITEFAVLAKIYHHFQAKNINFTYIFYFEYVNEA